MAPLRRPFPGRRQTTLTSPTIVGTFRQVILSLAAANGISRNISGSKWQIIQTSISMQPLGTRWITAGPFGKLDHEPTFGDTCIAHRVIGPAVRERYILPRGTLKTMPKTYVGP